MRVIATCRLALASDVGAVAARGGPGAGPRSGAVTCTVTWRLGSWRPSCDSVTRETGGIQIDRGLFQFTAREAPEVKLEAHMSQWIQGRAKAR